MIHNAKVSEIKSWEKNKNGWYICPDTGDWVRLGNGVTLGDWVTLGDKVRLGNWVTLGNGVALGNGVTSKSLNKDFISELPVEFIAWKWVTKERKSPNFDGGTSIEYPMGDTIEVEDAKVSDQQCDKGLHIL